MQWWKRIIRIGRMGLLGVAGMCLLLYAASFTGVWWYTPWRVMVRVHSGGLTLERYGSGAIFTKPATSTGTGPSPITSTNFGTSGMTIQTDEHWLWTASVLRGVPGPMSVPPPKPGMFSVIVRLRLGRLALIAGVPGSLLLLVPARRIRPGTCRA